MMAIVVLSAARIYARNIPKHRAIGFQNRLRTNGVQGPQLLDTLGLPGN